LIDNMPIPKEMQMSAVRTRLKELREKKNLTRMDIVRKAEVSYPTVVRWENDELDELDTGILKRLCNVLGCTIDEFLVSEYKDKEGDDG
jgi:transcriptional regulator with XRE-family HTH domain